MSNPLRLKLQTYTYMGEHVPEHLREALFHFIAAGRPPGNFLAAVLCNDLKGAMEYADPISMQHLPAIVGFLYNEAPAACWGSEENYNRWLSYAGGLALA